MKTVTLVWTSVAILVIAGGTWYWLDTKTPAMPTYLIEGQPVTLINGRAETPAALSSASKVVTQYFGNVAAGDLSGDNLPDVAFIITQSSGEERFYYVVATLSTAGGGLQGTNAVLLGNRITPQTTEIRDERLIVNYAERAAGEPMTASPSVGVSKYLKVENGKLVEIQP